jgi:hypothetical protein
MAEQTSKMRGLDLLNPDVTPPEEWESFREGMRATVGYVLPTAELFGEFRPDIWKRFAAQSRASEPPGAFGSHLRYLHYYAIIGHVSGVLYQIRLVHHGGHTRDEIVETLGLAAFHSPNYGMHDGGAQIADALRSYEDPERRFVWPEGWAADPDAFRSGVDFTSPEMAPGEIELIEEWHRSVSGEVPRYVRFLGTHRPDLLKAYRNRLENLLRVLPKQMMPFLLLHFETIRGHDEGIREAALLARGFGMTRSQALDAVASALNYAGHAGISTVDRAAGDVFAEW